MVLPKTAEINGQGHLEIGGCDTVALADEYGTPLYVFDYDTVVSRCRAYKKSFADLSVAAEIIYAGKAFMSLALCEIIAAEGLSIDVSSGGELYTAVKSGFHPERIYMHGNNKTRDELELALEYGVGTIVVDSFNELTALDAVAAARGRTQDIFIRLTPGIRPRTHEYIQTGQVDSKFGFGIDDGLALEAVRQAQRAKNLHLTGLHSHIGSQIFAIESFKKTVEIVLDYAGMLKAETGFEPETINLGGGLGIRYRDGDEPASINDLAVALSDSCLEHSQKLGLNPPELAIEPGRSIVGNACVTLYRVGTVKAIPGVRTYISVDGGMSDNIRPMLYGAEYTALLANKASDPGVEEVTVAGKHCESGDILIKDVQLPKVELGDILCTPATGAYGYSMANNFNMQPKPAVVMVKEGRAETMIARQSYDDLVRGQKTLGAMGVD